MRKHHFHLLLATMTCCLFLLPSAPAAAQKRKKLLFGKDLLLPRPQHQGGVVAERTPPVASGGENRAGRVPGIVKQCQFLQTVDLHFQTLSFRG